MQPFFVFKSYIPSLKNIQEEDELFNHSFLVKINSF